MVVGNVVLKCRRTTPVKSHAMNVCLCMVSGGCKFIQSEISTDIAKKCLQIATGYPLICMRVSQMERSSDPEISLL